MSSRVKGCTLFYHLYLPGKTRGDAVSALRTTKTAEPKRRYELIRLQRGKRSVCSKLGKNRSTTLNRIVTTPNLEVGDLRQAKAIYSALTGMTEANAGCFDQFHSLLSQCLRLWKASEGDRNLLGCLRRTASRLN